MKHLSSRELSTLISVRPPLLMVDSMTISDDASSAEGIKRVSMDEPHFAGHFPEFPVMPGVLQVTAMLQMAQALFMSAAGTGKPVIMRSLSRTKFRSPVTPGCTLKIECQKGEQVEGGLEFTAKCTLENGKTASSAVFVLTEAPDGWFEREPHPEECPATQNLENPLAADIVKIMSIIPHRHPFLFADYIHDYTSINSVVGIKNIPANGIYTTATTPNEFPPCLQIETAAQIGCIAVLANPEFANKLPFFMAIDSANFYAPVLPGDQLAVVSRAESIGGRFGVASGELYVGTLKIADAAIKFAIVPKDEQTK